MRGATYERFYVALVLTVAFVFVLSATVRFTNGALRIASWVDTVTAPANMVLARAAWDVSQAMAFATGLIDAENEAQRLEKSNAVLRSKLVQAQSTAGEVPQLERLLNLARTSPVVGATVAADVIARSPATWFDTIEIDRGATNGIKKGDAVLGADGLAGHVIHVMPNRSSVLLLPDPQSSVGAMDARSRQVGVVTGQGAAGELAMEFYNGAASVHPGDAVSTSGLTGLMPKGLPIGHVVSVHSGQFGLVTEAMVRTLVNFDRLEYVLVVKRP